jgi:hypothetical protein
MFIPGLEKEVSKFGNSRHLGVLRGISRCAILNQRE